MEQHESDAWPPQLRLAVWVLGAAAAAFAVGAAVTGDGLLLLSAALVVGVVLALRVVRRR